MLANEWSRLNADLTFSNSFGSHGGGDGQLYWPLDVAFDSTGVYMWLTAKAIVSKCSQQRESS